MRVLQVIASADPKGGGPIEGIIQQAKQRPDWEFHLATLDPPGSNWPISDRLRIFSLGNRVQAGRRLDRFLPWIRYGYSPKLIPWLKLNARHYDLIVVNGLWNYTALAARIALARTKVPYVVFAHGMLDPWFRKAYPLKHLAKQTFWWFSEGPLLRNASSVFFTTEEERLQADNAFWPYKLNAKVVGYGTADLPGDRQAQINAFFSVLPGLKQRRFLLFMGRIHPKKGCDLLIDAFGQIANSADDLDLVIAGPDQTGWRDALERRADSLNIGRRVHWTGMLAGDVKWGAFRSCDAFVLPSHQENFGVVVAEALAAGKIVLISDKVNIWRQIVADGAGFVSSDDLPGVVDLLRRFLALQADQRNQMSIKARNCFLEQFEIGAAGRTIFNMMQQAAAKS